MKPTMTNDVTIWNAIRTIRIRRDLAGTGGKPFSASDGRTDVAKSMGRMDVNRPMTRAAIRV